jgi:cytochrome P450 family 313
VLSLTLFLTFKTITAFKAQDTTALTVASTLLLLAMHKDIQNKLFQELRDILPSRDADVDFDTLSKLPYLDQVVNESMRLFPVVPFATKLTDAEVVLSDCILPKGVSIGIFFIKTHTNPEIWGDDAHLFKPERFEKEKIEKIHPYAFLPFSSE